ncbi:hypothetical protein PJ985_01820 [Streptomyces sp. ACA25]|uniref:hypothetical protein n=1 Tax=Streptomyces sp. ACA25 TaxID=3022596 RepID=UPI002307BA43|nr:hypothetical protein [Streptomyces sp. ACA25]MDB1086310.1 hypothetical protein [Streptomyces sp. ACA25]
MSDDVERVDPSGVPEFTGDLVKLDEDHADLSTDAETIRGIGSAVHTRFQGLSAFYQAPEAEELFATTGPVKTRADDFATDLETVSSALSSYAGEIRPLVAKLRRLKTEATTFVDGLDDDWRYDGGKVERNNELVREISTTVGQFWAAERTAANKIIAIWGGTRWAVDDGSGADHMYGVSTEELAQAGETPWGKAVEQKRRWYEVHHHVKSFVWDGLVVDGIWGTLTGLGGLVGLQGFEVFKESWKGLGQLATGLALISSPVGLATHQLMPDGPVKDWMDDSLTTTKEVGKSLLAWDEWSENPARAAGLVTFNVLTTVATLGVGTAIKTTSSAGTAARVANAAGRVGIAIDPMTYLGRGVSAGLGALPKLADVTSSLGNLTGIRGFELPDGSLRLPDGTTVPPGAALPDLPPGVHAVHLPDGTVRLPDGSTLHPNGQLDAPTGQTAQTPDQVPAELSSADRAALSADDAARLGDTPEPALVGAGARDVPGSPVAQAGGSVPPGGGAREVPSGGSGSGSGGDLPGGSGPGGDLPGGANHVDDAATGGHTTEPGGPAGGDRAPSEHGPADGGGPPAGGGPEVPGAAGPDTPRGNLPDGSWAGENGLRLDPEVNAAADEFMRRSTEAEPRITETMQDIARGVDDGKLNGLEYRLKGDDSLKRKLATDLLEDINVTPGQALGDIKDSIRYTVDIPGSNYTQGVQQAVSDLQARGYENVTFKNTWDSAGYKGINSTWRDPVSGQIFEVQFHTPESFAAKMDGHALYEAERLPGVSPDDLAAIRAQQQDLFGQVPVPHDAGSLSLGPLADGSAGPPGGWGGAGWVDEPSQYAGQFYEKVRATPNKVDLPEISRHTGVDESVLRQVKSHLFRSQHEVAVGPGETRRGLFTPRDDIADLWRDAQAGKLDPARLQEFRSLMAHEYIESRLMESGLPYVDEHPSLYRLDEDGTYSRQFPRTLDHIGAHELAPHSVEGHFNHWKRALGIDPPAVALADDLSNIGDVMKAVMQQLRAEGLNLT